MGLQYFFHKIFFFAEDFQKKDAQVSGLEALSHF
jgi:hypothetical protein